MWGVISQEKTGEQRNERQSWVQLSGLLLLRELPAVSGRENLAHESQHVKLISVAQYARIANMKRKSKHGGKREGAGRKYTGNAMVRYSVRLSLTHVEIASQLGKDLSEGIRTALERIAKT